VRLMSPDDAEGAADALLARELGARRVLIVEDGGYGALFASYFRHAATRLGLGVVDSVRWNPHKLDLRAIAARARQSGAEAVFLCGLIDTNVVRILPTLRRALAPSVSIVGCDGLLPVSLLFDQAGPAARGTYVSIEGLGNERLGSAGKGFLREFGETQHGSRVDIASVYAARAAEVLLEAIASSDGTRASVSSELFGTRVDNGLVGSFEIDAGGDPIPTPVTIVRLEHGGGSNAVASYEGARIDRKLMPPRRLLAPAG
jgi:branched-chain amino acid transport system substrate-binding protein